MLEAVRGSSKYCGCRFSLPFFSLSALRACGSQEKGQPPRSRADDLILLHHSGFNKKGSCVDKGCDGIFQVLEIGFSQFAA
jgi:hypothetical protein